MRPIQPQPSNNRPQRRRDDLTIPLPHRDTNLAVPLPLPPNSAPSSGPTFDQLIPFSELDRLNRIGSGSGGTVYKVLHRPTNQLYALKAIYGHHEDSVRRQIHREIQILRNIDDQNVVKCHDMYDHNGEIQVLLELMDGGSLEGKHIPDEKNLADVSRQILGGLAYLHRRHIVHRDIKPSNLLINSGKQVKIADFGMGRILNQTMDPCNSSVGTIAYMSPERINTGINDGKYDAYAGDIWSLGVSILEFYMGRFPFSVGRQGDWASLMCAICMSPPPEAPVTSSPEFRDFISRCLEREPSRRWSVSKLLEHPFIAQGIVNHAQVRMVTGYNHRTAKAIALECGILASTEDAVEPNIIEGKRFCEPPEKEMEQVAKRIMVMRRSSHDKLLLLQALRKGAEVVAVTGDGTNDAPALHEADIGLAMGIAGTEVAKESSDIIILDDNFASVVKVVRWGRSVYANIQKFIQFQLAVNVAALVINVVAAISSGDVPLNAVQLLWVNLIMDTLGALALATKLPTDQLMNRSPVGRREPLITKIMWRNLLVQAVYQVVILLVLNFGGESILPKQDSRARDVQVKNTLIFNAFVMFQIFNKFNARKPEEMNVFRGGTKNKLFMGIVGVTFILQIIIIEFLGKFTSTVRLDWELWLASFIMSFVSWPLAIAGKFIPVPQTPLSRFVLWPLRRLRRSRAAAAQQYIGQQTCKGTPKKWITTI